MFLLKKKEPWQIAAARWCVDNSESGFVQNDLQNYIQKVKNYKVSDRKITYFVQEEINLIPGTTSGRGNDDGTWIAPLSLTSMITDYDELKEARKNANGHKGLRLHLY